MSGATSTSHPWAGFDRHELLLLVDEIASRSFAKIDVVMIASARWRAASARAAAAHAESHRRFNEWQTLSKARSPAKADRALVAYKKSARSARMADGVANFRFDELTAAYETERQKLTVAGSG